MSWIIQTKFEDVIIAEDIVKWCDENEIVPQALYKTYDKNGLNCQLGVRYYKGYTLKGRITDPEISNIIPV